MSLERVKEIAYQVREVFEKIAGPKHDLHGYCGRASIQLYLACKRAGLSKIQLWDGASHSFNVYEDMIVDITATQFGKRNRVYVIRFDNREKLSYVCEYFHAERCLHASHSWANGYREDRRATAKRLGF